MSATSPTRKRRPQRAKRPPTPPDDLQQLGGIKRLILDAIAARRIGPGDKLPSEREFSEEFGTTRITLREALSQLETDGTIYREDRRGWFLASPRLIYNPLHRSYFDRMVREQGRRPFTEVLASGEVAASPDVARRLGLPVGETVVMVRRARYVDGRAILYAEHYLNRTIFPGVLDYDLARSLTEIYEADYGIRYGDVRFDIAPLAIGGEAARALRLSPGTPGLKVDRVNRDQDGRIIDYDRETWRHDAILVSVEASSRA